MCAKSYYHLSLVRGFPIESLDKTSTFNLVMRYTASMEFVFSNLFVQLQYMPSDDICIEPRFLCPNFLLNLSHLKLCLNN